MPDYHQIVHQIRGIVQSSDQTRNERLEQLAADHAAACGEVNQRLGRCQWLLQQGLRSEAIQLADSEPRLLDAVAVLDFRERAEWDELVGIYGLAAAPSLMVEAAGFLNEAYAQEEPLQALLVKHRRLAMQRSPLRMRIGVMRSSRPRTPITSSGATTSAVSKGEVPANPGRGRRGGPPQRPRRTSGESWRRSSSRNGSSRHPSARPGPDQGPCAAPRPQDPCRARRPGWTAQRCLRRPRPDPGTDRAQ